MIIRVLACGLCHSDLHMIDNDWRCSEYPLVPGHEVVGIVEETGSQVAHLRPGDRVGVGWQRASCGVCDDCVRGEESLCDRHDALIVGHHGGFAEFVEVDARFAFPLPQGVATNDAGPLLCGGITVYSALRHAGLRPGSRVGVIGLGGLGHLAVKFASALGSSVTVFTGSASKHADAARFGAKETLLLSRGEPERAPATPLDILLDTTSGDFPLDHLVRTLASDGTLCLVGAARARLDLPLHALLEKRRRVMASPIGGTVMIREMLRVADALGVRPETELFPMADANLALDRLRANAVRYRAVLTR